MNRKIKDLDLSSVISLDIETARGVENFDENHPNFDTWAWKQRKKETNEILPTEELISIYNNKAALYAEWGKIVCISLGYVKDGVIFTKSFKGDDEKQILQDVVSTLKSSGKLIVGHNLPFDIPYMRKRFFINGLTDYFSEMQGNDVYCKPWDLEKYYFDTMTAWKGMGYENTSLGELAMVLNIPSPKGSMHGNEVSEYYYSGRIEEIATYCEGDVATVLNVISVWQGGEIMAHESKTNIAATERDVFEELLSEKSLTENIKRRIKDAVDENTDFESLQTLICAHYLTKGDKKAEQKKKEKEVEEFIKTLK